MSLRQKLAFYLEDISAPAGKIVNLTIVVLVLVSSVIFIIETYPIDDRTRFCLKIINTFISLIFALEYLLRLWRAEHKVKYIFSLYSLIDLLAIAPVLIDTIDISFIRILRWFRILRLIRFFETVTLFGRLSREDSAISTKIIFTLFTIIFVYSGLIYQIEHPVNPEVFNTFLDAVYFSVVTMTTVGFGDAIPSSAGGRLVTVMMILTGIALIPWQLGDLIRRLVKSGDRVEALCPTCQLSMHDADARFCKICGTKLKKSLLG